jgi:hypothetical protein
MASVPDLSECPALAEYVIEKVCLKRGIPNPFEPSARTKPRTFEVEKRTRLPRTEAQARMDAADPMHRTREAAINVRDALYRVKIGAGYRAILSGDETAFKATLDNLRAAGFSEEYIDQITQSAGDILWSARHADQVNTDRVESAAVQDQRGADAVVEPVVSDDTADFEIGDILTHRSRIGPQYDLGMVVIVQKDARFIYCHSERDAADMPPRKMSREIADRELS